MGRVSVRPMVWITVRRRSGGSWILRPRTTRAQPTSAAMAEPVGEAQATGLHDQTVRMGLDHGLHGRLDSLNVAQIKLAF
jgi:hypothetical protein